jgi:CheY-like chemotaxis protein
MMPITVLLVDDDPDDRSLISALLRDVDLTVYRLIEMATYDAGLEAMLHGQFDVCLIDYRLGSRDGLDLLGEALVGGCRSPLILLTGSNARTLDETAMQLGAADYLVKDQMTAGLLERTIRHAIERVRTLQALRESEERFRLLVDGVSDHALFLLTPTGHVASWNASAERLNGYTDADGRPIFSKLPRVRTSIISGILYGRSIVGLATNDAVASALGRSSRR